MAGPTQNFDADVKALEDYIDKAGIAATATKAFTTSIAAAQDFLSKHSQEIGNVAGSYAALAGAQRIYESSIYENIIGGMQRFAMIPRRLAAEVAGGNVLLMNQASEDAQAIQRRAYEDQARLKERVELGFGDLSLPIASYYKNAAEFGAAYRETALAETRIFNASMKALDSERGFEIEKFAAFAKDGIDLQTKAMTALYQEEFSKTGAITGKAVEDFSAIVLAAQKVTGENVRQLSSDMQMMVNKVEVFGNATYSQMASLSNVIHQVGLDIDDVEHAAAKFMSFESATKAVSDLGAALGVSLDTMNLFYLANEDKEGFILSLRQQLIDQGVAFEDLTFQEQKYVAQAAGIGIRQAQSLFNSQIDVTQSNVAALIESTSKETEYQGDQLAAKLVQTGGFADKTLDALKPENLSSTLTGIKNLTGGTNELANESVRLTEKITQLGTQALPEFEKMGNAVSTAFSKSMHGAISSIKELDDAVAAFAEDGGLNKLLEVLKNGPFYPRSIPPAWQPIVEGAKLFSQGFAAEINKAVDTTSASTKDMSKLIDTNLIGVFETADAKIKDLTIKYPEKVKEIQAIATSMLADDKKVQADIEKLKSSFDSFGGENKELREARIAAKYKDMKDFSLTPEETGKMIAAFESGTQASVTAAQTEIFKARTDAALTKASTDLAKPATPSTPSAPVVGTQAPTTESATSTAQAPTQEKEVTINLKLDLVKSELSSLIHAEVVSAISDAVKNGIQIDGPIPGAGTSGGHYRIKVA
jgi:hypothetical protein